MAIRYNIPFEGHKLELVSEGINKGKVYLDGNLVVDKKIWSPSPMFDFEVEKDGQKRIYKIQVKTTWVGAFQITLTEQGRKIYCGEFLALKGGDPLSNEDIKTKNKIRFTDIPRWGWIGVGFCGIIPFITLGGALPATIGFCGAYGCYHVSQNTKFSLTIRVVSVLGIVVLTWVVFLISMVILSSVLGRK